MSLIINLMMSLRISLMLTSLIMNLITRLNNELNKFFDQNNKNSIRIELIPTYSTTYTKEKLVRILNREAIIPKQ